MIPQDYMFRLMVFKACPSVLYDSKIVTYGEPEIVEGHFRSGSFDLGLVTEQSGDAIVDRHGDRVVAEIGHSPDADMAYYDALPVRMREIVLNCIEELNSEIGYFTVAPSQKEKLLADQMSKYIMESKL